MQLCQQKLCRLANGEWWLHVRRALERCFLQGDGWVRSWSLKLCECNSFIEKVCLREGWVPHRSKAGVLCSQARCCLSFGCLSGYGKSVQFFNGILVVLSSSYSWPLAAGTGCLKQITKDIEATEIIVVDLYSYAHDSPWASIAPPWGPWAPKVQSAYELSELRRAGADFGSWAICSVQALRTAVLSELVETGYGTLWFKSLLVWTAGLHWVWYKPVSLLAAHDRWGGWAHVSVRLMPFGPWVLQGALWGRKLT